MGILEFFLTFTALVTVSTVIIQFIAISPRRIVILLIHFIVVSPDWSHIPVDAGIKFPILSGESM